MSDLEQRVKALETKVKILEETLETLKNMQLSEQMDEYIQSKSKSLKLVNLINSLSAEQTLDFRKEEDSVQSVRSAKITIDQQIAAALRNSGEFSEQYPDDPRYFNYEVESGMVTDWNNRQKKDNNLSPYIGNGIRITSSNGFEVDRIIVPKEIDGYPVISIGENAFKNAFQGCTKLKHIDLPEGLEYLGEYCFSGTGLESLHIPDCVKVIPTSYFWNSKSLDTIVLESKTRALGHSAFSGCIKLNQISLPESVEIISTECFEDTAIKTLIVPSRVYKMSHETFGSRFLRNNNKVTCVFWGKETLIEGEQYQKFMHVEQIYCLPGSNVQKYACKHSIPIKPLSEFDLESI